MASRQVLTGPEQGLVRALVDLSAEAQIQPRASFSASLRDRLIAEAQVMEAEEAEAFHLVLEGAPAVGEVAVLAGFASALAPSTPMRAPATLRDALRTQLTIDAEAQRNVISFDAVRTRRSAFATRMSRRLAIAAALSAMLVSSSAFALVASADDTPVDTLYGVKKFRERVQTWFISGTVEGVQRLRFADARVGETEVMLDRGVVAAAPYGVALDDLQLQVTLAADLIVEGQRNGDPGARAAIPALATFLADGRARLAAIESQLPEGARPVADETLSVLDAAAVQTESAAADCVLCPDGSLLPTDQTDGDGSSTDPDGSGDGSSTGGGILPRPNPDDSKDPGDDDRPGPVDEDPIPDPDDPIPTPLPEPDRVPDLPGRIDDELEPIVGSAATDLIGSL